MSGVGGEILPPLREDIQILESVPDASGAKNWGLHDLLQHRYFQIDELTRDVLRCWRPGLSLEEIQRDFEAKTGRKIERQEIAKLVAFVRRNNLTQEDDRGTWRAISQRAAVAKKASSTRLAFKLLFFKIPLFRPQRTIEAALPFVEPLYSRTMFVILAVLGVAGLYLLSRQWQTFLGSLPHFLSWSGAALVAISLFCLKALHELGHAFTAARYGCRVSSMGIAFLFLTPLLYTDLSDAWRLPSRRKRMLISAAGVLVELAVAIIATFLWAFLPDGGARSIAFTFATIGWVMSLAFNLNPLMKFDGYYLLCDLIGIDNLQPRSFALGRWKLRRLLLAPRLEAPEQLPAATQNVLILYAWMSWLYRLAVFTGLALLAYHFTFKLLGIILFAIGIWLLLLRPVLNELINWRRLERDQISDVRLAALAILAMALTTLFIVPWSSRISIPAVLVASDLTQLYSKYTAKITKINLASGHHVEADSPLMELNAPEIDSKIETNLIKQRVTKLRLSRVTSSRQDLDERLVLLEQLGALQTELQGLHEQQKHLIVTAPFDGTILQIAHNLHEGRWVDKRELLVLMTSNENLILRGYVAEGELHRLSPGNEGRFIPDDPTRRAFHVRLDRINDGGSRKIEIPELATVFGGSVVTERDQQGSLIPREAQYLVELRPVDITSFPPQTMRGVVILEGKKVSLAARAWRQITRVLVRESSF